MSSNYHTPIAEGAAANAESFNVPLGQMDEALTEALLLERDGHIIQEEGVDLAQMPRLNFVGAGVSVANSGGKSVVTIPGGTTDHGALSGLSDDDHPQYLLASGLREWDEQGSNPSTPATNKWKLFFKSGGLYYIDDAGVVLGPLDPTLFLAKTGLTQWDEQGSSPSSPSASKMLLYFKSDEKLYKKNPSGTETEIGAAADYAGEEGSMKNGRISVTVVSNNITLALKTVAGSDPSSSDPVKIVIGGTERTITSALSVTVPAGTNTFNAGSAELATKAIDYFPYFSWRTASSAVVMGFSRIPYACLYSDFSSTATNEKYAAFSTAPASTDVVVCWGRFEATLSAGAGYTWSVPTFTAVNLIQRRIDQTRWLTWAPTHKAGGANYTNAPTTNRAIYKLSRYECEVEVLFTYHASSGGSSYSAITLPFAFTVEYNAISALNSTAGNSLQAQTGIITAINYIVCYKYDGTSPIVNSNVVGLNGKFRIN